LFRAGAAGGADLLPCRSGLDGVVQNRLVAEATSRHLASCDQLQVLGWFPRLIAQGAVLHPVVFALDD
jgi:hypothetical protein